MQREFDLDIISTAPSVIYKFALSDNTVKEIDNPAHYPDPAMIAWVEEPWVKCHIITPSEYMGGIMNLGLEKRGSLHQNRNARRPPPPPDLSTTPE